MKTYLRCKLLVSCRSPTGSSLTLPPGDNAMAVPPGQKAARLRRYTALAFARVRGLTTPKPDRLGRCMVAGRVTRLDRHNRRGGRSGVCRVPDVDRPHRCKAGGASRIWLLHSVRRVEHRAGDHGGSERPCGSASSSAGTRPDAGPYGCTRRTVPAEICSAVRSLRWRRRPDAAIGGVSRSLNRARVSVLGGKRTPR